MRRRERSEQVVQAVPAGRIEGCHPDGGHRLHPGPDRTADNPVEVAVVDDVGDLPCAGKLQRRVNGQIVNGQIGNGQTVDTTITRGTITHSRAVQVGQPGYSAGTRHPGQREIGGPD